MEFRLLGPFEVERDGQALRLGSGKEQALLALLVLHHGRSVSSDIIVDELWGARPPPSVA